MKTHPIAASATYSHSASASFSRKLTMFHIARLHYSASVRLALAADGYDAQLSSAWSTLKKAMVELTEARPASPAELASYARIVSEYFDDEAIFDSHEACDVEIALLQAVPRNVNILLG